MNIALDIDHVIANIDSELIRLCPHWNRRDYKIDGLNAEDIIFSSAVPMDKPTFDFECYITNRPESSRFVTERWLRINGFPNKPVHFANHNKAFIMQDYGIDVIIDDSPFVYSNVTNAGLSVILYTQLWNTHIKTNNRIFSLKEINDGFTSSVYQRSLSDLRTCE